MHKVTPKQVLKLCRCLIHSDNLDYEGLQYANVQSTKVLFHNLRYKTSNLDCGSNPFIAPLTGTILLTNFNINTIKYVQYFMRRSFYWQHWNQQNANGGGSILKLARRILGIGVFASAAYALLEIFGISPASKQPKRCNEKTTDTIDIMDSEEDWEGGRRGLLNSGRHWGPAYSLLPTRGKWQANCRNVGITISNKHSMQIEGWKCKYPANSEDIPNEVEYLVVGGGTAAFAASRAIRGRDATAKILIISKEPYYPYMKPPLSKELLFNQNREMAENLRFPQWSGRVRSIFYEFDNFYTPCDELDESETGGVAVARGWKVVSVDASAKTVTLEDGKTIMYGKCLLATGSTPTKIKVVEEQPDKIKKKITYYNNLSHFRKIDEIVKNGAKSIVIYGNGLLCCELACALALRGKFSGLNVTIIMPTMRLMQDTFPPYLCDWLRRRVEAVGVTVIANHQMNRFVIGENNILKIAVGQKKQLEVDHLIVCTASKANTEIAEASHLEVDTHLGGFIVNSELAISSNLYAAGDCASYYDVSHRRRRNLLQYDHAVVTGRIAGENMTGAEKQLHHQAMLWSELGANVGFESVGILDSDLKTVGFFLQPDDPKAATIIVDTEHYQTPPRYCHKGVVFYLKNRHIEGILMWNLYGKLDVARQILAEHRNYTDLKEIAKLFELYNE